MITIGHHSIDDTFPDEELYLSNRDQEQENYLRIEKIKAHAPLA